MDTETQGMCSRYNRGNQSSTNLTREENNSTTKSVEEGMTPLKEMACGHCVNNGEHSKQGEKCPFHQEAVNSKENALTMRVIPIRSGKGEPYPRVIIY